MTDRTRGALIAIVATAALVLAGCGSNDHDHDHPMDQGGPAAASTTPPPPPLPAPFTDVDQDDAEAVLVAAAESLFSYRPAEQSSQVDAAAATRPLLDDRFFAANEAGFGVLAPITGAMWERWRSQGAAVTATAQVTSDAHPADQPARISRVLAVTVTAHAPDGTELDRMQWPVYMSATKLGVWRVSAVAVR
ncbi:hypothetical protein [Rhodococcus rhodnii]|uniref:hypothetical protein n=1 Tax=Rhodococcus rhodnii TaxID=38312 RepID=UPI000934C893|nr:hypothetical protein [Rhodococcus rhodnii]